MVVHEAPDARVADPAETAEKPAQVGGIKSERWAVSYRNGGRHQIGMPGRIASESTPEILDVLAARPDGTALGYAWLQYLIWSGHAPGRWRKGTESGPPARLLTVLQLLAAWLPRHREPEQWVEEEQEPWRNDRIYSVLIVLLSREPMEPRRVANFFESVLKQDLATSGNLGRFASDSTLHERYIIGSSIAAIPDATGWFGRLWADLFNLRDRARRYRHGYHSRVPANVGQIMVIWGLCGLGFVGVASEGARTLWVQLELAVREGILTEGVRLHSDAWRAALCWLGAYWPSIFSDDPPTGDPGSLDDFVSFWAAPHSEFAVLINELHTRGVTIAQIGRSLPNGQLLRHGAEELGRMRDVDPGSRIATAIRTIADEIDALHRAK